MTKLKWKTCLVYFEDVNIYFQYLNDYVKHVY